MRFSSDHHETKTDACPSKVRVECLVLYLLRCRGRYIYISLRMIWQARRYQFVS